MELSLLCDANILLCVFDKNDDEILFYSSNDITTNAISEKIKSTLPKKFFTNNDVI